MSKKKLEYEKIGDFYLPKVYFLAEGDNLENIGKYGILRLKYLKEHKKGYYTFLMINGFVPFELRQIDNAANEKVKKLIQQMAEKENINEELKTKDQMEWVQAMNNIKNRTEEIALKEIIYV